MINQVNKMNPGIRDEWATRLESGKYSQGQNFLCQYSGSGQKHCCWGVLAEMAVEAGISAKNVVNDEFEGRILVFDDMRGFPKRNVLEWAGFDVGNGDCNYLDYCSFETAANKVIFEREPMSLTYLNDNNFDFKTIAKLIREQK